MLALFCKLVDQGIDDKGWYQVKLPAHRVGAEGSESRSETADSGLAALLTTLSGM